MYRLIPAVFLAACAPQVVPTPVDATSGFAEPDTSAATPAPDLPDPYCPGGLHCPSELGCEGDLVPGPSGTCTRSCASDLDCVSEYVDDSVCFANLCGIVCDTDVSCEAVGMWGDPVCRTVWDAQVCGY